MRFLFIGSRFMLHASFPRSVALTQLRFTLLTVTSLQRDLHPQVCAHAGRTWQKAHPCGGGQAWGVSQCALHQRHQTLVQGGAAYRE